MTYESCEQGARRRNLRSKLAQDYLKTELPHVWKRIEEMAWEAYPALPRLVAKRELPKLPDELKGLKIKGESHD